MTEQQIKRVIKKCRSRYESFKGTSRNDKYVICKEHCLPCYEAIVRGQCETLKEAFKAEREEERQVRLRARAGGGGKAD